MDYHGISMKGPFIGQRVSSLPTWTSNDIGRELYLTTTNKRYYANDVGWIDPNVDNIWTYQNTAPIGWSIVAGTTDALLACKGGAQSYNTTGETQAGTWTQTTHTHTGGDHTLTEAEMPSHTHTGGNSNAVGFDGGGLVYYHGASLGSVTGSTGGGNSHSHGTTSSSGTASTYRPLANIGIIIEKD